MLRQIQDRVQNRAGLIPLSNRWLIPERRDHMLTVLFCILLVIVFGKLLLFALRAAWGILKILLSVVFLPLILIGLLIAGFIYVSLGLLVVIGIIVFVCTVI